jgi:hypothetical protein
MAFHGAKGVLYDNPIAPCKRRAAPLVAQVAKPARLPAGVASTGRLGSLRYNAGDSVGPDLASGRARVKPCARTSARRGATQGRALQTPAHPGYPITRSLAGSKRWALARLSVTLTC